MEPIVEYRFVKGEGWIAEQLYFCNGKRLTLDEALKWLEEDMAKAVFNYLKVGALTPVETRVLLCRVGDAVVV